MQRKAVFFGSRVDKLDMIIVFSIAVIFSVSGVQADPVKPKGSEVEPICCPTKLCYQANVSPGEKMEFVIKQTTCTCRIELNENCMKTYRDIEFAISRLYRIHNFGITTTQVPPVPVAPSFVDGISKVQKCCVTKLCVNIAYQPQNENELDLVIALTPTDCACFSLPGINCLDSFEEIVKACSSFLNTKYIMGL